MKVWSRCAVVTFVILTDKIDEKGAKQRALLVFVGFNFRHDLRADDFRDPRTSVLQQARRACYGG